MKFSSQKKHPGMKWNTPSGYFFHTNITKLNFSNTQGKDDAASVNPVSFAGIQSKPAIRELKVVQRKGRHFCPQVGLFHNFLSLQNKNKVNCKLSYLYTIPAKSNIRRAAVISIES